jgi:DNA-binding response OmpR family regulator
VSDLDPVSSGPIPTLLLVDDQAKVRLATRRILEAAGFAVREGATGAEALELAATMPDLIILDVRLPDLDGFDVCRRLKADSVTGGIYMSGYTDEQILQHEVLDRGRAFLPKPFKTEALARKVREVLDRPG